MSGIKMNPKPFKYDPLPTKRCIRVLRRLGTADDASGSGLPNFSFKVLNLDSNPKDPPYYHCLSYTWGNPLPDGDLFNKAFVAESESYSERVSFPVIVDGMVLQVQKNLYEFMTTIRSSDYGANGASTLADDYIWIDAVCINQQDMDERASQVSLMHDIYSLASYVVVWLGKEDEHVQNGLSALSKLSSSRTNITKFINSRIVSFRATPESRYDSAGLPRITQAEWDGLASLFLRQWFSRVWIVQEIVLARYVLMFCGDKKLDWAQIEDTVAALSEHDMDGDGAIEFTRRYANNFVANRPGLAWMQAYSIRQLRRFRQIIRDLSAARKDEQEDDDDAVLDELEKQEEYFSLFNLTTTIGTFRATNPRDHCYALLPMRIIPSEFRDASSPFAVDYTAPVEKVYTEFTKEIIRTSSRGSHASLLSVLFLRNLEDFQTAGSSHRAALPSWVPDYQASPIQSPLCYRPFKADMLRRPLIRWRSQQGRALYVGGYKFDTIDQIVEQSMFDPKEWFRMFVGHGVTAERYGQYQDTGQSLAEALWRTLCMDRSDLRRISDMISAEKKHGERFKMSIMIQLNEHLDDAYTEGKSGIPRFGEMDTNIQKSEYFRPIGDILPVLKALHENGGQDCIPSLEEMRDFAEGTYTDLLENTYDKLKKEASVYEGTRVDACAIMKLFRTQKGYIGLAPRYSQVGDGVWILGGCKAPVVLRGKESEEKDDKWENYQFLGVGYVHGIMYGEAVAKRREGERFKVIALV
ncbi:heterokaryon incompatibility protein-domain-containing protein [Cladorrhinum sp. PSN259]|nr:heterokaryon incompatibility protein-domain-containing protein [Cladorrhinum sp. PSN259]